MEDVVGGVHLVRCTLYFCRPRVYADRVRLPNYVGCPGDRVCIMPRSVTCPIPFNSSSCRKLMCNCRGKLNPRSASRYITSLLHAHVPGLVDSSKEFPLSVQDMLFDMFTWRYMFMRSEDLPRARAVWESTVQTNYRKSMWEVWDKVVKITCSQDPTAWMDYGPVWMRRDYWESLCHRWATGPWQGRSQAAKRNRAAHLEKNVHTSGATHSQKLRHELEHAPTFCELFDQTHKRKGMDDYVSKSARTIAETYCCVPGFDDVIFEVKRYYLLASRKIQHSQIRSTLSRS
ncbi:hypothetical protein Taro_032787 [Colocasia esculenta]|uniref:Uncharacterized protein n=1 Tax=Colocasia esculenta TaxID=4460 RepID=A0A843W746_COLES|nr:hypothetical protein [Colocasia esculenta]